MNEYEIRIQLLALERYRSQLKPTRPKIIQDNKGVLNNIMKAMSVLFEVDVIEVDEIIILNEPDVRCAGHNHRSKNPEIWWDELSLEFASTNSKGGVLALYLHEYTHLLQLKKHGYDEIEKEFWNGTVESRTPGHCLYYSKIAEIEAHAAQYAVERLYEVDNTRFKCKFYDVGEVHEGGELDSDIIEKHREETEKIWNIIKLIKV